MDVSDARIMGVMSNFVTFLITGQRGDGKTFQIFHEDRDQAITEIENLREKISTPKEVREWTETCIYLAFDEDKTIFQTCVLRRIHELFKITFSEEGADCLMLYIEFLIDYTANYHS